MIGDVSIKYVFYWGVAALALIALAGPLPDIATMLTLLLITGVVLTHYKDYVGLLTPIGTVTSGASAAPKK